MLRDQKKGSRLLITFYMDTQLEIKLYLRTFSHHMSKFCKHPIEIDFIGTYLNFQLSIQ